MTQKLSHVAVTVPPSALEGAERERLLEFYGEVLGWHENPVLSIPGQRIFLRAPTNDQYLTIRASEQPMQTSGYEHLGVAVSSESELRSVHERTAALAERFPEVELEPVRTLYGGALMTFRLRFGLPLTLEIQFMTGANGS